MMSCIQYDIDGRPSKFVLQATCDHRGVITSYDHGWPGSVQDSRVFRLSHLWQHKEDYFRNHEYILVDKGVTLHASFL